MRLFDSFSNTVRLSLRLSFGERTDEMTWRDIVDILKTSRSRKMFIRDILKIKSSANKAAAVHNLSLFLIALVVWEECSVRIDKLIIQMVSRR